MDHDAAINHTGASKGTLSSYLTGFVLAIVLTIIPFWLVMSGTLSRGATIAAVFAAATVQILVHLHYFLHLDRSSEEQWNVMAIAFTAIAVVVVIGGSVWIMVNLHERMADTALLIHALRPLIG
ncbi:MAG TPA: cytochrome o ubiquinol oxidase subunit IV [Gammaproteobacteria bacterium]|nr:cytochrome o ubiquinol oxidase subunit IV [Gammaproteobacteria bacterium]